MAMNLEKPAAQPVPLSGQEARRITADISQTTGSPEANTPWIIPRRNGRDCEGRLPHTRSSRIFGADDTLN